MWDGIISRMDLRRGWLLRGRVEESIDLNRIVLLL